MHIRLNGERKQLEPGCTVEKLLAVFRLDPQRIAVELNRAILPRSLYGENTLKEGDEIEIVRFIGGG